MATITFYRQAREDGSTRTGIEIDREPVFGRLEESDAPFNPRLTWYVNVDCVGDHLPDNPDEVRRWLLGQADIVRSALEGIAADINAGLDVDPGPQEFHVPASPDGARITVVYTAIRRLDSQQLASVLRAIAADWKTLIENLPPLAASVA